MVPPSATPAEANRLRHRLGMRPARRDGGGTDCGSSGRCAPAVREQRPGGRRNTRRNGSDVPAVRSGPAARSTPFGSDDRTPRSRVRRRQRLRSRGRRRPPPRSHPARRSQNSSCRLPSEAPGSAHRVIQRSTPFDQRESSTPSVCNPIPPRRRATSHQTGPDSTSCKVSGQESDRAATTAARCRTPGISRSDCVHPIRCRDASGSGLHRGAESAATESPSRPRSATAAPARE